jgi:hypothetical protein
VELDLLSGVVSGANQLAAQPSGTYRFGRALVAGLMNPPGDIRLRVTIVRWVQNIWLP